MLAARQYPGRLLPCIHQHCSTLINTREVLKEKLLVTVDAKDVRELVNTGVRRCYLSLFMVLWFYAYYDVSYDVQSTQGKQFSHEQTF